MLGARLVMTDKFSPVPQTLAGRALDANMELLRRMGCSQMRPRQRVSAFEVSTDLQTGTAVFLAGSPANHDPQNQRIDGESRVNNVEFKQEVSYSLCWNTPTDSAVALTYSFSACPGIEWWSVQAAYPPRVMMVVPAWFRTYRPRLGLEDTLDELADEADTMLALYMPASFVPLLRWYGDRLDASATFVNWLGGAGRIVTFGAYTGELEADVVSAGATPKLTTVEHIVENPVPQRES